MVDKKVMIGVSTGEYSRRADFYDYLNLLDKTSNSLILLNHDRSPAKGRNIIFELALEHNCTHVLLIDDDMSFPADGLVRLLNHDKDIVTGIYYGRAYPHQPLIFDTVDETGHAFFTYLDGKLPELIKIEAAGFGFCLIKTSVLLRMEKPWVRLGEIDCEQWCDDIGFFHRAKQQGITDIWCDTTLMCGHIGTVLIQPQFDEKTQQWMTGYNTNGKGMISTPQIMPGHSYMFTQEKNK